MCSSFFSLLVAATLFTLDGWKWEHIYGDSRKEQRSSSAHKYHDTAQTTPGKEMFSAARCVGTGHEHALLRLFARKDHTSLVAGNSPSAYLDKKKPHQP